VYCLYWHISQCHTKYVDTQMQKSKYGNFIRKFNAQKLAITFISVINVKVVVIANNLHAVAQLVLPN